MGYVISFGAGFFIGGILAVFLMCLAIVANEEED